MYRGLLLMLVMSPSPDKPFDPRTILADEWVAYVNKLADRLSGENAAEDLELAAKCFTYATDLPDEGTSEARRAACQQINDHELALALADLWKKGESRVIDEWLTANTKTLRTLKRVAAIDRCYRSYRLGEGRDRGVLIEPHASDIRFTYLLAIKANQEALGGRWASAYQWNLCIQELAARTRQQPDHFDQQLARHAETVGYQQLLSFFRRHYPSAPGRLMKRIEALDDLRLPDQVLNATEAICTWDIVEAAYEWADQPDSNTAYGELIHGLLDGPMVRDMLKELGTVYLYESVEEYRAALQASSANLDWEVNQKADQLYQKWHCKPFHEAWSEVETLRAEYWKMLRSAPSIVVYGCSGVIQPDRGRCSSVVTRVYRGAVQTVIAIKEYERKKASLPKSLKQLPRSFDAASAVDPFSGEPFGYRRTADGKDFILYSVGSDQKDDGGRHNDDWYKEGDHVFWPPQLPEITREEERGRHGRSNLRP